MSGDLINQGIICVEANVGMDIRRFSFGKEKELGVFLIWPFLIFVFFQMHREPRIN